MSGWAQAERRVVVETLAELGPDAPTVPEGWQTADLAAHLYVRERRPDAALGVVLPGRLARHTDRVMASVLRVHSYDHIVNRIGDGPPLALRPIDEAMNLFEFFVHAEDIRRANDLPARELPADMEQAMWRRLRTILRPMFRKAHRMQLEFVTAHGDRTVIGSGPTVRVFGPVGEIVLYAHNRKSIAAITLTGDVESIARLDTIPLGL